MKMLLCLDKMRLYLHINISTIGKAVKICTNNATWFTKKGIAWTDYRPCLDREVNTYACHASFIT